MKRLYLNLLIMLFFFSNNVYGGSIPLELSQYFDEVTKQDHALINANFYTQNQIATSLDNFDNRFIILHFWASWCMDCSIELKELDALQKEFRKKSLLVIAITEDYKDLEEVDKYYKKHEVEYLDIYLDKKNALYQHLMLNNLPVSYLIDFNGNIIAKSKVGKKIDWTSEAMLDFLESKVSKLQLLPPEFKKQREKYEPVKDKKDDKEKKKKIKKEDF